MNGQEGASLQDDWAIEELAGSVQGCSLIRAGRPAGSTIKEDRAQRPLRLPFEQLGHTASTSQVLTSSGLDPLAREGSRAARPTSSLGTLDARRTSSVIAHVLDGRESRCESVISEDVALVSSSHVSVDVMNDYALFP